MKHSLHYIALWYSLQNNLIYRNFMFDDNVNTQQLVIHLLCLVQQHSHQSIIKLLGAFATMQNVRDNQ